MLESTVTPRELLYLNGDFKSSPLLETLHRLDSFFVEADIPYAVVGGMAVVRNGAPRTTMDIDILLEKKDWNRIRKNPPEFLETGIDSGRDRGNGVDIDILHPGNEWEMEVDLPHPGEVSERDENLGGCFIGLIPLLTIKCAVYRKKLREDGIEIAAKDLYDLTELIKARKDDLDDDKLQSLPGSIASTLAAIKSKVVPS